MNLEDFIDQAGQAAFGTTRTAARQQEICISCKEPVKDAEGNFRHDLFGTPAGIREYGISGMCEKCFDSLFADED